MRVLHIDTGREMRGGQWQVLLLLVGRAGGGARSVAASQRAAAAGMAAGRELACKAAGARGAVARIECRQCCMRTTARGHTRAAVVGLCSRWLSSRRVAFPIPGIGVFRAGSTRGRGTTWPFPITCAARFRGRGSLGENSRWCTTAYAGGTCSRRAPHVAPATKIPLKVSRPGSGGRGWPAWGSTSRRAWGGLRRAAMPV